MKSLPFRFEPLSAAHDRTLFRCGEEILDRYLQTQATQDIRRRVSNCFVAVEAGTGQIAAYYTLSAASIPLVDLPPKETKRLPRYPTLPAVRIGRLAVDQKFQGRGLGAALLMNAAHRTIGSDAAFTLLVDAKNDQAVAFYEHYGFRALTSRPQDAVSSTCGNGKDIPREIGSLKDLFRADNMRVGNRLRSHDCERCTHGPGAPPIGRSLRSCPTELPLALKPIIDRESLPKPAARVAAGYGA